MASALPIRSRGTALARREKHAERNEEIAQHLRVRGERIRHEDVTELSILCFGDATDQHALERRECPPSTGAREYVDWKKEGRDEDEEVEVR